MEFKAFQDIKLSRLGMGNMRLPVENDKEGAPIDYKRAQEIIDYAMEQGINYYDTAYVYHNKSSEDFLGVAMKKYDRGSYYLATKYAIAANEDFKACFEEQLEKLQTSYIDFYLIHNVNDRNIDQYIESGCIEYFEQEKAAGRIKYLGFSCHGTPATLERFASYRDWDFAQIQLNYYDWEFATTKEEYDILVNHNIPIMVMEPVRGGKLANLPEEAAAKLPLHEGWSHASYGFHFVKALPQVQVILSGMSTLEQMKDNVNTFSDEYALTEQECDKMAEVARAFKHCMTVPCTACRYCCDDCPSKIDIPKFIELYNKYKMDGAWGMKEALQKVESEGTPEDCIGCGTCTGHCPQNIEVPGIMSELKELMK